MSTPTPEQLREYADWDAKYCPWTAACARACATIREHDKEINGNQDYADGYNDARATMQSIVEEELGKVI